MDVVAQHYAPSHHPDYGRLTAYMTASKEQRSTLTFTRLEQAILLGPLPYGTPGQGELVERIVSNVRIPCAVA
jgi:hypothetical protein